ncbi:hypothetical protein [Streptomyces sp. NPDC093544]|uniref:hypothetical protein n=1 Tax=Streptomyces sp. NPDC093544 TaxID=3155200 RepID=UPI003436F865
MSYDAEHARHPQTGSPDPTTPRASQTPHTESAHAPPTPGVNTDGLHPTPGSELLPQGERDKATVRLQQALSTFVDSPRQAVEQADAVFDDVATQFTNTLAERRRGLRATQQDQDADPRTEQLRLTLGQYRDITERLLHMSAPAGH